MIHTGIKPHSCPICKKTFVQKSGLTRHTKTHTSLRSCLQCPQTFSSKGDLLSHVKSAHPVKKRQTTSQAPLPKRARRGVQRVEALNTFSITTFHPSEESMFDFNKFFEEVKPSLLAQLQQECEEKKAIKWYGVVQARLVRTTPEGDLEYITPHFRSSIHIELVENTIREHLGEGFSKILNAFENFTQGGSNWVLEHIIKMDLHIATYHPLRASSYIDLPQKLKTKKALLNIQNTEDELCLVWCILAHQMNIDRSEHPERVYHYTPFEREIKLGNTSSPVPLSRIPYIEKLNNLRINVFGFEEEVFPLYVSPREDTDVINLLLISNEETSHYCLIRNFSRLLGDLTHYNGETFYCYRCLHRFSREDLLTTHTTYCKLQSPQNIKMPEPPKNILKFENTHYEHTIPYIIYADFESLLVKNTPIARGQYTHSLAEHKPCGYAYVIINEKGEPHKPVQSYRGEDAVPHFLNSLLQEKEAIGEELTHTHKIIMNPADIEHFNTATHCTLCHKPFTHQNYKVRDHDHLTGAYRGALHNLCNLKFKLPKKIPVVFHNLKHYDAHLIMQHLGTVQDHTFQVVPSTLENYISFSITNKINGCKVSLTFIDSFQFMNTSLQKLVHNLDTSKFNILQKHFPQHTSLLLRKGVYPYEYMDTPSKFNDTELPSIQSFYSTLTGEHITSEDYEHAQHVWETFNIHTMGEYHDLYVQADTLQLADVFQNFRSICLEYYKIDCLHLMTAPGLAWQACLKMCDISLELFTDIDMHLFIEKGIRGGISMITERFAQANNRYIENFKVEEPSNFIMYWDANNLYGWAMSRPLPYGEFEWYPVDEKITPQWILSIPDDAPEGFIFEVDLDYPSELHDSHNAYPLAVEKMNITYNHLSPFSKQVLPQEKYTTCTKLVPNLYNKKHYVTHYLNLKFYITQGLKLVKIHKILKFKQSPWLKPYIDFNTERRQQSTTPFEKDFFKLMNNAVYGKTLENIRKHRDVQLINTPQRAQKLIAAPTFKRFSIFDNDLVAVERLKQTLTLNKPIYTGFVILELSKLLMYDFHYNYIQKQYGNSAHLLFTDTDSLTYSIYTEDIYRDMAVHQHLFDTSDYPKNHSLFSNANKKKIGKFKDEMNSSQIFEFIGLRPKMYSLHSADGDKKTAKGVSKHIVKNKITHQHYKHCLETHTQTRETQYRINSHKHHIHTLKINKTALSPFDDKRYILEDGIHTLAHGHHTISHPNVP